jgi:hypothetical protein
MADIDEMAPNDPNEGPAEPAGDQGPGRRIDQSPRDDDRDAHDLGHELDEHQPSHRHATTQRDERSRCEPEHEHVQRPDRHQKEQIRLPVKDGARVRDEQTHAPEHGPAYDLHGPGRVQVDGLVPPLALDDRGLDAHVREHREPLLEDHDERRDAEGLGEEQAGQHQVARQAQDVGEPVTDQLVDRASSRGPSPTGGARLGLGRLGGGFGSWVGAHVV